MNNTRPFIKVYIPLDQKKELSGIASRARISLSELCRRLLTGVKLPSPSRYQAVKDIVRVNADLARLGNLFKLALDDKRVPRESVKGLINDITRDREKLKEILDDIRDHRKL